MATGKKKQQHLVFLKKIEMPQNFIPDFHLIILSCRGGQCEGLVLMGTEFRMYPKTAFFPKKNYSIPVVANVLSELKILVICFYLFLTFVLHLKINI